MNNQQNPKNPKVTIIMNVYNGALHLREALESALAQDFTDWELLAWDDWSRDESADIIKSYTDPRIRYVLAPQHTPLGAARKEAIRASRGEWIAFLDQDDIWLPHKLRLQLAAAEGRPRCGMVYGRTVSFDARGRHRDFDHRHEFSRLPEGAIFERLFVDACFIAMSSTMFRHSAVMDIAEIPTDHILTSPEYYLMLGVAHDFDVRAVQEVICLYRWHGDNMTFRFFNRIHEEVLWLIDWWAKDLDPRIASYRRKVHHSVMAYHDLRDRKTARAGLIRLLRHGSIPYLLSRPFARSLRAFRRRVQRPYWLTLPAKQRLILTKGVKYP